MTEGAEEWDGLCASNQLVDSSTVL